MLLKFLHRIAIDCQLYLILMVIFKCIYIRERWNARIKPNIYRILGILFTLFAVSQSLWNFFSHSNLDIIVLSEMLMVCKVFRVVYYQF